MIRPQHRTADLKAALQNRKQPLLLDGAMGTELLRRGVPTPLPLWSAPANVEHAGIVEAIHRDYIDAGCRLITTNTFRTSAYAMERAGRRDRWLLWNRAAVELARRAAGNRAWVLGSVTTLEDCYRPEDVPEETVLRLNHALQIDLLVRLGVDAILLETFNTLRELRVAYTAARIRDLPVFVSVVLADENHLYDGTPLLEVIRWINISRPDLFMINCTPPEQSDRALQSLSVATEQVLGVYANVGKPGGEMGFEFTHSHSAADYARWAAGWVSQGVQVVGGCCGTTPDYLRTAHLLLG